MDKKPKYSLVNELIDFIDDMEDLEQSGGEEEDNDIEMVVRDNHSHIMDIINKKEFDPNEVSSNPWYDGYSPLMIVVSGIQAFDYEGIGDWMFEIFQSLLESNVARVNYISPEDNESALSLAVDYDPSVAFPLIDRTDDDLITRRYGGLSLSGHPAETLVERAIKHYNNRTLFKLFNRMTNEQVNDFLDELEDSYAQPSEWDEWEIKRRKKRLEEIRKIQQKRDANNVNLLKNYPKILQDHLPVLEKILSPSPKGGKSKRKLKKNKRKTRKNKRKTRRNKRKYLGNA
jgi:hypothetical protein